MRVKTDDRRNVIIDAAIKVFRDEGYARASMDNIARLSGGSKATLYGYFKSKEELFEAAMKSAVSSAEERINKLLDAESEDLRGVLIRSADAYLEFILSDEILAITRAIIGEGPKGLGPVLYDQGPRHGIDILARFFSEQIRRGRLREANPLTAALHFKGLIESDHLEAALYNAKPSRKRRAAIIDAVDVFLAAYGAAD